MAIADCVPHDATLDPGAIPAPALFVTEGGPGLALSSGTPADLAALQAAGTRGPAPANRAVFAGPTARALTAAFRANTTGQAAEFTVSDRVGCGPGTSMERSL